MSYFDELTRAMTYLSSDERTVFLGQQVEYSGSGIYGSLKHVPLKKRIEMPIAEDMQLGISIGLSLMGKIPVSIYPRFDFLLCATNQLVNMLDKIQDFSDYRPKVIIRTAVGSTSPLFPGIQHCGDYTMGFRHLLKNVIVIELNYPESIVPSYRRALKCKESVLLIEKQNNYGMD